MSSPLVTAPGRPLVPWHRLRRLTGAELRLLLLALPTLALVRLALWGLPSTSIVRLTRRLEAGRARGRPRAAVRDVSWAVQRSARVVPGASCLTQAIAALLLLRAQGHDATLCIGAGRTAAGDFRAHAWLERDGRVVIGGGELHDFVRFPHLASTLVSRRTRLG
ncbi:MAG TPA: lasso peptide biosynthesis B2 protein [Gemmatimonadaceae bacterium]|nr:lasso peptide biosynthesis B2 protein [Gemmatimonadaceae bacterium]